MRMEINQQGVWVRRHQACHGMRNENHPSQKKNKDEQPDNPAPDTQDQKQAADRVPHEDHRLVVT